MGRRRLGVSLGWIFVVVVTRRVELVEIVSAGQVRRRLAYFGGGDHCVIGNGYQRRDIGSVVAARTLTATIATPTARAVAFAFGTAGLLLADDARFGIDRRRVVAIATAATAAAAAFTTTLAWRSLTAATALTNRSIARAAVTVGVVTRRRITIAVDFAWRAIATATLAVSTVTITSVTVSTLASGRFGATAAVTVATVAVGLTTAAIGAATAAPIAFRSSVALAIAAAAAAFFAATAGTTGRLFRRRRGFTATEQSAKQLREKSRAGCRSGRCRGLLRLRRGADDIFHQRLLLRW